MNYGNLYYEDFEVGRRYPMGSRRITLEDHLSFCKMVGYEIPIFVGPDKNVRPDPASVICPSHLIMSFTSPLAGQLFANTLIGLVALDKARFHRNVRPGDTLRTEVEVVTKRESSKPGRGLVTFRDLVYNQHDELVFQNDKTAMIRCRQTTDRPTGQTVPASGQ